MYIYIYIFIHSLLRLMSFPRYRCESCGWGDSLTSATRDLSSTGLHTAGHNIYVRLLYVKCSGYFPAPLNSPFPVASCIVYKIIIYVYVRGPSCSENPCFIRLQNGLVTLAQHIHWFEITKLAAKMIYYCINYQQRDS